MDTLRDIIINKTRKPHKCFGCCRVIQPGARMGYVVVADTGTVDAAYFCDTCTMIRYDPEMIKWNDLITEGLLRDTALEIENRAKNLLDKELKEKHLEFIGGNLNDSRLHT